MDIKTFSVTQVNRLIKNALDVEILLKSIAISGEISNLKTHTSGHIYFSLKDESNVLNCVMFKRSADLMPHKLENGMNVIAIGEVSFFERNGQVTLNCEVVIPQGQGLLNNALEELKEKLKVLGYFDYKNKIDLPKYPEKVAVVTSATGAVIEDIKNIASRRNKNIEIVICPVKVQGIGAEKEISQAIKSINKYEIADVIIVARGGGSAEDLMAFNTELVARAVFESRIPVVSAVGHETDTSICDLVADRRASTPSEAAEIVFPISEEMQRVLNFYAESMNNVVENKIIYYRNKIERIKKFEIFDKAEFFLSLNKNLIDSKQNSLELAMEKVVKDYKNKILLNSTKLEKYNPIQIINQGYALVYKEGSDEVTESIKSVKVNDELKIKLKDGNIFVNVKEVEVD